MSGIDGHFIVMKTELQFCLKNSRQKWKPTNDVTLKAYSEPCQTSTMVLFPKNANGC